MSSITFQLHQILNQQRRFKYPFEEQEHLIPSNGIYCIFEKGERYGDNDRIVRVGSHTGNNKLLTRLKEHFIKTNKDRSIFRKNIGRALLHKANDPYLSIWEKDFTPKAARTEHHHLLDPVYQENIEQKVSSYIQENLSFAVVPILEREDRLYWEAKLIATLAQSSETSPSANWLGHDSPKEKIRTSGLWQEHHLNDTPMDQKDFLQFLEILSWPSPQPAHQSSKCNPPHKHHVSLG